MYAKFCTDPVWKYSPSRFTHILTHLCMQASAQQTENNKALYTGYLHKRHAHEVLILPKVASYQWDTKVQQNRREGFRLCLISSSLSFHPLSLSLSLKAICTVIQSSSYALEIMITWISYRTPGHYINIDWQ